MGNMRGYDAALADGAGTKLLFISAHLTPEVRSALEEAFSQWSEKELMKQFRVSALSIEEIGLNVSFLDNPGTMKRLRAFLDVLFPILDNCGVPKSGHCALCGGVLSVNEGWRQLDGQPICVHSSCAERFAYSEESRSEQAKLDDTGIAGLGFLGAFLGALLGAVVWGIIFCLGYVSALGGLLIGLFAAIGYDIFHGRKGKVKLFIIALCIVLGVAIGTVGGYAGLIAVMLKNGELQDCTLSDFSFVFPVLMTDPEVFTGFIKDFLLGLVFAALGSFATLRGIRKKDETRAKKITKL